MDRGKAREVRRWLESAQAPEAGRKAACGQDWPPHTAAKRESKSPAVIGDREWEELKALLAPISDNYLRKLLRDSGVPLEPLIEGVRQESLDALETSLGKLLEEYERGDRGRRMRVRGAVVAAKDHARWASGPRQKDAGKRAEKQEMILWMTVWLENPPLFAEWVRLRRARLLP